MKFTKYIVPYCIILIMVQSGCKDDDPKPFKPKVDLVIQHFWNDSALVLNKAYFWNHDFITDTISTSTLIYHINNLKIVTQDNQIINADHPYYMVDLESKSVLPESIKFTAPKEGVKYYATCLEMTIGIADSLTNRLGLLSRSFVSPMYWGMIQGYINFKYEALSPQAKNNALIYHIGGYTKPYINSRKIILNFDKPYYLNKENTMTLSADILKIFNSKHQIDIRSLDLIHSPDANSALIADNMASMFQFYSFK